jgi:hypothetical protein
MHSSWNCFPKLLQLQIKHVKAHPRSSMKLQSIELFIETMKKYILEISRTRPIFGPNYLPYRQEKQV